MTNEAAKEWWDNPALAAQFEKEYEAWESGKENGYGWGELKTEITKRKLVRRRINRKSTKE